MLEALEALEPTQILLVAGLMLGLAFGVLAQYSGFCFRAAVQESASSSPRRPKLAQWLAATVSAVALVQAGVWLEWIDLSQTPYLRPDFSLGGLVVGGLLFGLGMAFSGGCISRLSVLAARGNLRSLFTLLVTTVVGYASIRGLLSLVRASFSDTTRLPLEQTPTLSALLESWTGIASGPLAIGIALAALAVGLPAAWRLAGGRFGPALIGSAVGAIIAGGFILTSWVSAEAFEPVAVESLRFTQPSADALMYVLISSGIDANFGIALFAGVLGGAFLQAAFAGTLALEGFARPIDMARAGLGGAAMGVGGVLALGCAIGQGLTGVATLALPSMIAFAAIWAGARAGFAWRKSLDAETSAIKTIPLPQQ